MDDLVTTLSNALRVLILTPATKAWLKEHDPKALEQAERAISQMDLHSLDAADPGWVHGTILGAIGNKFAHYATCSKCGTEAAQVCCDQGVGPGLTPGTTLHKYPICSSCCDHSKHRF